MITVPKTREEALQAIASLDAAKWGEEERSSSIRVNSIKSYGLLLSALARRPEYDFGDSCPELVAAAEAALTAEDRQTLRMGG